MRAVALYVTAMPLDYSKPLRLRFAPSPTGMLHVGGARTALFNYLLARKTGGAFVLRIEDTDESRNRIESEAAIYDDLRWLGMRWDEGPDIGGPYAPYRQSERSAIYAEQATRLLASGAAYKCFCTSEELEADRHEQKARGIQATRYSGRCRNLTEAQRAEFESAGRPYSINFAVNPGTTVVEDLIKGRVSFDHDSIGDFVVVKSTGGPLYNFTAAVDDALMEISLVLRGDEHLDNTPRQMMLQEALGLHRPMYAHVGLILNEDKSKLSKRHNTVGTDQFRKQGVLPAALINHLALLGWSPGTDREAFTLDDLVHEFTLERVGKSGSIFNETRLRAFNARELQSLPREQYAALVIVAMQAARLMEAEPPPAALRWVDTFLDAYGEEIHTIAEAIPLVEKLRDEGVVVPALELERLRNRQVLFFLDAISQYVDSLEELRDLPLSKTIPAIADEFGIKKKDAFQAIRMALMGDLHGPPLPLLFPLLGHDRIMMRIGQINSHVLHGRGLDPIKYGPDGKPFQTIQPTPPPDSATDKGRA